MKKFIIFVTFFLLILILFNNYSVTKVKAIEDFDNSNNHYELIFDNELLNFRNIKLKLGLFTSYNYKITKVYIKYPNNIKDKIDKEYFSFDDVNFNKGVEELELEYANILKSKYLFDELEKGINDVQISKIEIYVENDGINKFKNKYPNVIINRL